MVGFQQSPGTRYEGYVQSVGRLELHSEVTEALEGSAKNIREKFASIHGCYFEAGRLLGLFGGSAAGTLMDVHDAISTGFPMRGYQTLVKGVHLLSSEDIARATGVSIRTVQRRAKAVDVPLSPEQSGRTWKFAEVLAQATEVFGNQEEGERWLNTPALAFGHRRPIDLLVTPIGTEMVQDVLARIEHGVYT